MMQIADCRLQIAEALTQASLLSYPTLPYPNRLNISCTKKDRFPETLRKGGGRQAGRSVDRIGTSQRAIRMDGFGGPAAGA